MKQGNRQDRRRRLVPFAVIALAPLVLAATSLEHRWALLVAIGLTLAVATAVVVVPWERLPWTARVAPVVCYCGAVAFARHAQGGSANLTLLLLLPVLYVALYAERADVYAAMSATLAALVVPLVVVGAPEYPAAQWQAVAVWLIVAPTAGCLVHSLVDRLRSNEATMARIAHVAHGLTTAGDNREAICRAAMEVTGADLVYLIEPVSSDRLASTAVAGVVVPPFEIEVDREPSGAVDVCRSGTPRFVADVGRAAISQRIAQLTGVRSAYFQPVLRGGEPVGVLVVGWQRPVPRLPRGTEGSMSLLASEAAVAMERADQLSAASRLASLDPLTGLPNRRAWDSEGRRIVAAHRRNGLPLSLAMLDVDWFKRFNDDHGHQAGDRLLKEAAAVWRERLRETDLLARWGGEEFAVLLPMSRGDDAVEVVERLRVAMPQGCTSSIGVTEVLPDDDIDDAVRRADAALYEAKAAGRDRSVLANAPVGREALRRAVHMERAGERGP